MKKHITVILICLTVRSLCRSCPEKYLRFTEDHSYCRSPNPSCNIMRHGLSEIEKDEIVELHNKLRNKLAGGNVEELPPASDVLQMRTLTLVKIYMRNPTRNHQGDQLLYGKELYSTFIKSMSILTRIQLIPMFFLQLMQISHSGNLEDEAMYQPGTPCSNCPTNSCCGSSCENVQYYELCNMNSDDEYPIYLPPENSLLYCEFNPSNEDCSVYYDGKEWSFVPALGGPYVEIVLKGGQTSTLVLKNSIKSTGDRGFCIEVKYRSGPNVAAEKFDNEIVLNIKYGDKTEEKKLPKQRGGTLFHTYTRSFDNVPEIRISVIFTVPQDAPNQYLNVRSITVLDGEC